jgi:hypothetical protein
MISRFCRPLGFGCALLTLLAGCGPRLQTYPVTGRVKLSDGSPLSGGTVEFESQASQTLGMNAQGDIQPDGTFRLKTWHEKQELDGAVPGRHRVVVIPPMYSDRLSGTVGEPPASPINLRFKSYDQSGLTFEVTPGPNDYPITVAR